MENFYFILAFCILGLIAFLASKSKSAKSRRNMDGGYMIDSNHNHHDCGCHSHHDSGGGDSGGGSDGGGGGGD